MSSPLIMEMESFEDIKQDQWVDQQIQILVKNIPTTAHPVTVVYYSLLLDIPISQYILKIAYEDCKVLDYLMMCTYTGLYREKLYQAFSDLKRRSMILDEMDFQNIPEIKLMNLHKNIWSAIMHSRYIDIDDIDINTWTTMLKISHPTNDIEWMEMIQSLNSIECFIILQWLLQRDCISSDIYDRYYKEIE